MAVALGGAALRERDRERVLGDGRDSAENRVLGSAQERAAHGSRHARSIPGVRAPVSECPE